MVFYITLLKLWNLCVLLVVLSTEYYNLSENVHVFHKETVNRFCFLLGPRITTPEVWPAMYDFHVN